jgi:exonuclease VII large subunit
MTHSNQILSEFRNKIRSSSSYLFETQKNKLDNHVNLLQIHGKTSVNIARQTMHTSQNELVRLLPRILEAESVKLEQAELHLKLLDPITILQRGYAIVTNEKGVLSAKNPAGTGEELKIVTEAQELKAKVK